MIGLKFQSVTINEYLDFYFVLFVVLCCVVLYFIFIPSALQFDAHIWTKQECRIFFMS